MIKFKARSICTDPEWVGRADCKHCSIRHMMLFSGLEDSDFDHILEPIDNMRYAEKTQLYCQGDFDHKVYSIRSGYLKLTQVQHDGTERIVRLLGHGAIVGLEALLDKPYRHSAVALKKLDVCRITTATLKQLEKEKPWLNEKVMSHWEKHLAAADRWISEMSTGSVRSRVLKLLSYLMEINGGTGKDIRFFGFEDMASMIGSSRETFSRIISELKDEGLIQATEDSHIYHIEFENEHEVD